MMSEEAHSASSLFFCKMGRTIVDITLPQVSVGHSESFL